MNRDPFDTLRSRNPAPPESLPEAPMAVASRITAGRPTLRRGLAIAAAAAALVLVAGGGWLIWSRTGDRPVVGPATTTTAPEVTTTLAAVVDEVPEIVVYFFKDGALMPVARDLRVLNVNPLPELGPLALELLLWGPGAWDAAPLPDPVAAAEAELTTAIPAGTKVLRLAVEDGIAAADLSAEFAAASPQAIAQVVYTLTGPHLEAEAVRFLIEGIPQVVGSLTSGLFTPYLEPAVGGSGMDSVGREILSLYRPAVMIEDPALGGTLRAGEAVTLVTRGENATLTLIGADGTLLWNAWAPHDGEPPYLPPEVIEAAGGHGVWVTLLVTGIEGGAAGASCEIPVWLEPEVPFTDEPDLPEATTTTVGFGLGEMRPLPEGLLTGCAAETARDLASFEAALANGPLSLEDLCALVGVPDGEVGSGLWIPVYDLDDGSRLYLGYTGPGGGGLIYANLVRPDGTMRDLLGG
jgi:spore germination protein GerM